MGKVIVVVYELEGEELTLGVIDDFEKPLPDPLVAEWDKAMDRFYLERVQS